MAHKGTAFELALIFERSGSGGWNYNAGIGAVWGNRQLADTFYGVAPVYATPQRAANAPSPLMQQQTAASVGLGFTYIWKKIRPSNR